jgi:hypothetical protein
MHGTNPSSHPWSSPRKPNKTAENPSGMGALLCSILAIASLTSFSVNVAVSISSSSVENRGLLLCSSGLKRCLIYGKVTMRPSELAQRASREASHGEPPWAATLYLCFRYRFTPRPHSFVSALFSSRRCYTSPSSPWQSSELENKNGSCAGGRWEGWTTWTTLELGRSDHGRALETGFIIGEPR